MKSETYHLNAIKYNETFAECAEALFHEIEDPEVKRWVKSIGHQHRYHANRHKSSLKKLQEGSLKKNEPIVDISQPDAATAAVEGAVITTGQPLVVGTKKDI